MAWWLFVGTQWFWHQPPAYQWALENTWAHYAEHLMFFGTAILFWWPVIGAAPLRSALSYPARMLYVFLAWVPNSILGAGITLAPAVLYPYYLGPAQQLGLERDDVGDAVVHRPARAAGRQRPLGVVEGPAQRLQRREGGVEGVHQPRRPLAHVRPPSLCRGPAL